MKHKIKITLFVCSLIFLAHCSGQSLLDPNLNTDNGIPVSELHVMAIHHNHDGEAITTDTDGHKSFTTDLGYDIELTEAVINWKGVKLVSSGDDPECVGGNDQEIVFNQFEDFLGEDLSAISLGDILIPKVAYCSYQLQIAPSPAATHKFHEGEAHGEGHQGIDVAFHLMGTWNKDGNSGEIHLMSTDALTIEGNFKFQENGQLIEHPLHFHEGEDEASVMFGTKYDLLLNGIDFLSNPTETDQLTQVEENLSIAVHQHQGTSDTHSH